MKFNDGFVWGAATAAYQIEGAFNEDGRGLSVWDTFCTRPGAVVAGDTGQVACDHYHRYREDVGIMSNIGLQAYRFSFSWSRLIPDGTGRVNEAGVEFYDRLIDTLLEHGIEPYATIFHWDYPYELYLRGGWLNRESVDWFGDYTQLLADRFSDRVSHWFTLNEPQVFLGLGHRDGIHAPGLKLDWPEFFLTVKHAMMAHGRAVQVLRASARKNPAIGYAPVSHVGIPADGSPENLRAAEEFTFGIPSADRGHWYARLYLDAVLRGEWPEETIAVHCPKAVRVSHSDLLTMHQPLDMLGLNFYSAPTIVAGSDGKPVEQAQPTGGPRTGFYWPVTPEGMYWSARFHYERYGLPIVFTENGLSNLDWVHEDGKVHDPQRIDFTTRYLKSLGKAIGENIPVHGYFHWSLLDNFEWAEGYRHRFGLVHVDFATQKRTLKNSAHWYRTVIESNGACLSVPYAVVETSSESATTRRS